MRDGRPRVGERDRDDLCRAGDAGSDHKAPQTLKVASVFIGHAMLEQRLAR
jgi:hypothetical protein